MGQRRWHRLWSHGSLGEARAELVGLMGRERSVQDLPLVVGQVPAVTERARQQAV